MHYWLEAARVLMQHPYQRLSAISAISAAQPLGVTISRFSGLPAVEQHTIRQLIATTARLTSGDARCAER